MDTTSLNHALVQRPSTGLSALNTPATTPEHDKLMTQAEKWVALTFYGTLLKQMRESPFKSEIFDGGRGGEMFASLYDQQLADHMSRSAGKKLASAIVRKIEANRAYAAQHKKLGSLNDSRGTLNVPTNFRT